MFKVGETVVHKREVCKVKDVVKNFRDGEDFYKLVSLDDPSLMIHTPVANPLGLIRKIITKKDALELIERVTEIEPVSVDNKTSANEYKALIDKGDHEDLIRIIKTAYLRKEAYAREKKRTNENDKTYFRMAESILYGELSVALNMERDEVKNFITARAESVVVDQPELEIQPAVA